ncbi:MarR family transcriptional regulator [Saccharothrix sp.]|uniref:MarR family winged helix-turn-helix transcriptional regulator n=1 Tax=Saccharothrix sp. TaxID=1873460 RepID=UPI0028121CEA|nr:MarR family transcriptional regulator [Saccharothrix sp.]
MSSRSARNRQHADIGVLAARLLFSVQEQLYARLAEQGFDDLHPRHGVVLAYLDPAGIRATEIAELSGRHKQVIGTVVDELEALGYVQRRPDPADRRAKLIHPTERGLAQMRAADAVMAAIERRYARRLGGTGYAGFKRDLAALIGSA